MKKHLLVCIAFHYDPSRIKYLVDVLVNLIVVYRCPLDIIIDTNIEGLEDNHYLFMNNLVTVYPHTNLDHPFHLTSMHRQHIKDNIDKYDVFMYLEDDMVVPYSNYLNYLENFKLLYPQYVPSFIRVEKKYDDFYVSDVLEKQELGTLVTIERKLFAALRFPYNYCALWIMPNEELKKVINDDFTTPSDGREFNAMFVGWGLNKKALVEIENGQVSTKCYSYHLPNNYTLAEGIPNGKIKAKEIFI